MKAISVKEPWASLICEGKKLIETRTWPTKYRGTVLIVGSRSAPGPHAGKMVCLATIMDCREMTTRDEEAACCPVYPGAYSWILSNIRPVKHKEIKGQLGLFDVNDKLIEEL